MKDEATIKVWCTDEEWCPVTATAKILGKKWHPVIIHRLLSNGGMGFNDMKNDLPGISNKVLSESLEDLQDKHIVEKKLVSEEPKRVKYSLTGIGESLEPTIQSMAEWGKQRLEAGREDEDFTVSTK